jgi:hypothetical protein
VLGEKKTKMKKRWGIYGREVEVDQRISGKGNGEVWKSYYTVLA